MLQYILNASAIWLVSLIVYDLFLKKETHFTYNRAYMILTFLAGILLPLWEWSNSSVVYSSAVSMRFIQNAATVKQGIGESTQGMVLDWDDYLLWIYCAGAVVALALFIADVVKLIIFYKSGIKIKDGKWTVVQTRKAHAPFSLFRYLFVNDREQYTEAQWEIILRHETQHTLLFHFLDQLIFQIGKIIFWFHPLVYIYTNRLLMLHEFQADQKSATDVHVYGSFLLEQALLQSAPAISHSFNRSPIKSRIVMLARRSSFLSRLKYIIIVPLIGICFLLFTQNAFSYDRKRVGDIIKYRGNTITVKTIRDTTIVIDPVSGKQLMKVAKMDRILKLNGEDIYYDNEGGKIATNMNDAIKEKIIDIVSPDILKLQDGSYYLSIYEMIFNGNGKLVYYDIPELTMAYSGGDNIYYSDPKGKEQAENQVKKGLYSKAVYRPEIDKHLKEDVVKKVSVELDKQPTVQSLKIDDTKVPFRNDIVISFTIKAHQLTLDK